MDSDNNSDKAVPPGWVHTKIGHVCDVVRGGSPRPMGDPRYFSGTIPFLKIADVTAAPGKIVFDSQTKVNEEGAKRSRLLPKGALVLTNSGTICVPKFLGTDACIHDGFVTFLNLPQDIDVDFLYHYFDYLRPYVSNKHRQGVTQVNLNTEIVRAFDLVIPPAREQRRIVQKLEELFSELDNGIESLKTAQRQLLVYRQAVLKWAFEGKLTAKWRENRSIQGKLETGEELLALIEQQRTGQRSNEHESTRQNKRRGHNEPQETDSFLDPPDLPEEWKWVKLGALATEIKIGPFGSLLHKSDYVTGGVPLVNPSHIREQRIVPDPNLTIADQKLGELESYRLHERDIVMGRRGEMGRCAVVTEKEAGYLCGTGSLVVRLPKCLDSNFYCSVLGSPRIRNFLEGNSVGTTMSNLNEKILNAILVPLCSRAEQSIIMDEIALRLSVCEALETCINEALNRSVALRQSILKRAFNGGLVPQDPSDEPADKLLTQIKEERQSTKSNEKAEKEPVLNRR